MKPCARSSRHSAAASSQSSATHACRCARCWSRLSEHVYLPERKPERRRPRALAPKPGERTLFGEGSADVAASRERLWAMLLDSATLAAVVPGIESVNKRSDTAFRAVIDQSDLMAPEAVTLSGVVEGVLGFRRGKGPLTLREDSPGRTVLSYRYEAVIGGRVVSIGGRLLDGAACVIIGQFFKSFALQAARRHSSFLGRMWPRLRGDR